MSDPRLVITDLDGDSATITRCNNEIHLHAHPEMVVISGEDLWRLRELINDLPEGAFVEPKVPWEPGDVIRARRTNDLFYIRGPQHWTAHGPGSKADWSATDEEMDNILTRQVDSEIQRRGGQRV